MKNGNVYGMLLYAQTINEPSVSLLDILNQHKIIVKTLDMNEDWADIKCRLNSIAKCFKQNSFQ